MKKEKTGRCGQRAAPAELYYLYQLTCPNPRRLRRGECDFHEVNESCDSVGRWQLDTIIFSLVSTPNPCVQTAE